jgi:hypothetical protein
VLDWTKAIGFAVSSGKKESGKQARRASWVFWPVNGNLHLYVAAGTETDRFPKGTFLAAPDVSKKNRRSDRMLRANSIMSGAIAVVMTLGGRATVLGQPRTVPPPPPALGASAAPKFQPLTNADARDDLAKVKVAAAALDERFASAGASANGWKEYLSWPAFDAELQKPNPDPAVLGDAYKNLAAGYEGLELKSFADLRTALGNYLFVAGAVGNPDLEAAVKSHLNDLDQKVRAVQKSPTTDNIRALADDVLWLKMARQGNATVNEVKGYFNAPNFAVQIGKELIDLGVGGPVDETAPIDDVILGTTVHGMGRTVGQTHAELNVDPNTAANFATFDAVLLAVNHSNNVGRNGPVCIYTTGETSLAACKRFWIDAAGVHVYPAAASAQACTTINNIVSIKGRQFVEKIAWRRAGKQKGEAEAIASQHAAARVGARVNAQADPPVQNANERYQAKVVKPLEERRAFPRALHFATDPTGLVIHATVGLEDQLTSLSDIGPPSLTQPADMSVAIHESMVNNLAESVLAGVRLNDDMVQRIAVDLTGSVPDKLKPENNQEPFTIVFPAEQIPRVQPVTVSFANNGFSVTLRGSEFYTGDKKQPGMYITANYKFAKAPEGYKAVRQGELQIYGFGLKPGTRLSARQLTIKTALQTKFGKVFEPEIKFQGFKFAQGKLASAGQFVPREIIAQNGWLVIGYGRANPTGVAVAKQ